MDDIVASGRKSVRVRARFSLRSMENGQAGRDGHIYLSRETKFSQVRTGRGTNNVFCSAGLGKKWRSYPVDNVRS